jgi:hypothetical protein
MSRERLLSERLRLELDSPWNRRGRRKTLAADFVTELDGAWADYLPSAVTPPPTLIERMWTWLES